MGTDKRINEFLMSRPEVHLALKTLVKIHQAAEGSGMTDGKTELALEAQTEDNETLKYVISIERVKE